MTTEGLSGTILLWLWRSTWQASLLALLVMLAQAVFRSRLTSQWRYALWLLVLVRLAAPILPESPTSIFNLPSLSWSGRPTALFGRLREASFERLQTGATLETGLAPATVGGTASPAGNAQPAPAALSVVFPNVERTATPKSSQVAAKAIGQGIFWLWALGVLYLGGRLVAGNCHFAGRLRRRVPVRDPRLLGLWDTCCQRAGVTREMELIETPDVDSPALFGFWRLRLLLPEKITDAFSAAELRYVFLHELSHVCRHDAPVNWLMALVQVVHWFNPIVWFAFSTMRADREQACDAQALSWTGEQETQPYGATILKLMQSCAQPVAAPALVGILEDKRHLRSRMRMIAGFQRTPQPWAWAAALLLGLGLVGLTDAYPGRFWQSLLDREAIVDTNTSLRFTVARHILDPSEASAREDELALSPNGEFLLAGVEVLPLGGGRPFWLVDIPGANRGVWSPDGTKVAFHSKGVWVIPVSARTAQPTGPAQQLYADDISWFRGKIWWSRDSQQLLFVRWDKNMHRKVGALSIADGKLQAEPDYAAFGLKSPEGQIAYAQPQQGVWVKPAAGGVGAKVSPRFGGLYCDPLLWVAGSQRLVTVSKASGWYTDEFRFLRLADGQEGRLERPEKVGTFAGLSRDGKNLLFYNSPFQSRTVCQVVEAGGRSSPRLNQAVHIDVNRLVWPPGDFLVLEGDGDDGKGDWGYWLLPISGGEPRHLRIETRPELEAFPMVLSPDGQKLLLTARGEQRGASDLYVVSVDLAQGHTVGEPRKVFSAWRHPHRSVDVQFSWSPDCSKVAIEHLQAQQADLWLVSTELPDPIRLTDTPAAERHPKWSPDGAWIAFTAFTDTNESLQVVSSRGGPVKTIRSGSAGTPFVYTWAPDSSAIHLADGSAIMALPLNDGAPRVLYDFDKLGLKAVSWIGWSPNGQKLGVYDKPRADQERLYSIRGNEKPIQLTPNDRASRGRFAWSPDSSSIAYVSWPYVKTAAQGTLYALNVQNAFDTLLGGSKARSVVSDATPNARTATKTPALSDTFDSGDLSKWTILPSKNPDASPKHRVVDGQLILQDTQAEIGNIEWTNYLATVRVCFTKNLGNRACAQLQLRRTGQTNKISNYCFLAATNLCLLSFREPGNTNIDSRSLDYYLTSLDLGKWYELKFEARGSQLKGYLDGRCVVVANDANLKHGRVLVGALQAEARFDDFSVRLLP